MFRYLLTIFAGLALAISFPARAQFPDRPITIIAGAAPGSAFDVVARFVGNAMSRIVKQPVVVDNRPGAASRMAADYVARLAKPDGYTLLLGSSASITAGFVLDSSLPYDPRKDLVPIGQVAIVPNILAVSATLPAQNLQQLVEMSKKRPNAISYGTGGVGSSQHLTMELLTRSLGVSFEHVPYKGTIQAATDVISGQVDMVMGDPGLLALINSGKLKAIGLSTGKRMKAIPNVPTLAEQGAPGFDVPNWFGLFVPKGTPPAVIAYLNQALQQALAEPELQEALWKQGVDPNPSSPSEFQAFLEADMTRWTKLVDSLGLRK